MGGAQLATLLWCTPIGIPKEKKVMSREHSPSHSTVETPGEVNLVETDIVCVTKAINTVHNSDDETVRPKPTSSQGTVVSRHDDIPEGMSKNQWKKMKRLQKRDEAKRYVICPVLYRLPALILSIICCCQLNNCQASLIMYSSIYLHGPWSHTS